MVRSCVFRADLVSGIVLLIRSGVVYYQVKKKKQSKRKQNRRAKKKREQSGNKKPKREHRTFIAKSVLLYRIPNPEITSREKKKKGELKSFDQPLLELLDS